MWCYPRRMWSILFAALVDVGLDIARNAREHPDLAERLGRDVEGMMGVHRGRDIHPDAVAAMVAGLAASRANVAQEVGRRLAKKAALTTG